MADPKIVLTAVDNTKQAIESVKAGLGSIQTKAVAVTGALTALSTGAYLVEMIGGLHEAISQWDELGKSAQRAGFQSAQGLAEFQFAAKLSGVDANGFETAIGKLSEKMAEAAGGGDKAAAVFTAMGIKIKDAAGNLRSTEDVVTDLAKAFASWKDGPEKTALALDLFGKAGKQLIPLLNGGADGLEKLRGEFQQLRGTLEDGTIKSSEQFNDNLTKLETAAGGLKRQMAENLLPGLIQITDAMVEQAKKGSTLLTIWAALKEAGKLAIGIDDTKSKKAQLDLLEESLAQGGDSGGKLQARINQLRGELFNTPAIQKSAADLESAYYGGSGNKPAAPIPDKRDAAAKESAYAAADKALMERIVTQGAELRKGRELTEMEKFEAKVLEDLNHSKVAVTDTERKDIQAKLANAKVQETLIARQRQDEKDQYIAFKVWEDEQKAIDDFAKKQQQRERDQMGAAEKSLKQIEFETSLIGMNNQQREVAVALHELENQGIKQGTLAYDTYAAAIQEAASKRGALNQAVDNFKSMWESIDQTAHDVWTNIWHGGSDVFKRLGQTLKASLLDMLYQMVVKKWVFNIAANVMGASSTVTNAVGNGVMQGSTGALVGGTSLFGGGSLLGAGASATMSNGLIGGFGANMANIGTLMEGGSYLTALSAAAPYLAVAMAAVTMLSGAFKGETRSGGQYSNDSLLQGPSGGEINGAQVRGTLKSTVAGINDTLKALGSTATIGNFQSGFESSERGKGFAYAGGQLSSGQIFGQGVGGQGYLNRRGSMTPEEAAAAFSEELKQATLQALQAADVPGKLGDYLRQLGDVDKLSGGALDDAINKIQKALTEKQQIEARIFDLTATDAEKLAKARSDERAAIDDSNQSLLDRLYALQDEKNATDAATTAAQQHADALNAARGEVSNAYGREKTAIESTRDRMDNFTKKFVAFRDSLLMGDLSPLTPGQKYAQAASDYALTVAQKNAGDTGALERFDSVAQAFLEASRVYNASGEQYIADFNQVYAETSKTVSLTQMQYDVAVGQLGKLDAMAGSLVDLNTNTMSLAEAIWHLATSSPGASGTVTSAYQQLLGRTPDSGGLNYWAARLATGMTAEQLTASIMASPEYLAAHSHARGGLASGLSIVGERGRELVDFRQPGRVYSAEQTRAILGGGGNEALISRVDALVAEVRSMKAQMAQGTSAQLATTVAAHEQSAERIVRGLADVSGRKDWDRKLVRKGLPA